MMKVNLQHPDNWEVFENLCFHLWKSIWGDHLSHLNGRRGQRQDGVDIYGKPPFSSKYTGIQCKGKNANYGSALTTNEIDAECQNAANFKPVLGSFIMATTSARDASIQEHCRKINDEKKYNYEVDTWSWDDIAEEVQCRPEVMERFYPTIKVEEYVNKINISRITPSNKLHAFFTRPNLFGYLNMSDVDMLDNLAYEMAVNAFEHGGATNFSICVDGPKITFRDNGNPFDPQCLLKEDNSRGGSLTLKYAQENFSYHYLYDEENIFELTYKNDIDSDINARHTILLDVEDVFGTSKTHEFAYSEIFKIPGGVNHIVIDIYGKSNPAISIVFRFFNDLLTILKPNQNVNVYVPYGLYYYNSLIDTFRNDTRIKFMMKE